VLEDDYACSLKEKVLSLDFKTKVPYLIISESEYFASVLGPWSNCFVCLIFEISSYILFSIFLGSVFLASGLGITATFY